jgi:hypothetical protein
MKNKICLLGLVAAYLLLQACNNSQASIQAPPDNNPASTPTAKTEQQLRQELRTQEEAAPTINLSVSGSMQENQVLIQKPDFFHHSIYKQDGYIIHGVIRSKASIARFKDVVVQITFYSETQTNLGSNNYIIYKYFEPNTETPFDLKVYPPPVMRNFGLSVVSASIP